MSYYMFRLTRWASVRVTVPRLFQHLLLPHPLARPASGAPIDPSSVVPRHHAAWRRAQRRARTISCYELDVPDCRRLGTYTVWSSIVYAMDTPHGAVLGNYTLHVY